MKKRMILSLVWVLVLGTTFLFGGITDEYRKARELKDKAGANTVEAVKEIIPYLGDPKPIYRDGAYQALRYNITDEKAIQLMAQELLRNRNVLVRENLAEILGYIGKNQKELVGKALLRSLTRDPKLSVRIEAARALGRLQYEPAVKALEKIFKRFNRKTWLLRGEALNSLFLIKGKDALPWVEKGLKDKDYIIRAYSLRLLGKIDSSKALDAAMEVLKKTKPKKIFIKGWQPVYVAFRIVLQSSQDKNVNLPKLREAITLIIELLKGLKGRIFYNAIQTLEKITGEKNIIPSYRDWRDYWAVNKDRFVPKPLKKDDNTEGKRPTTVLRYHGAPLYSTRVVFLVDHSGSMKNRLGEGDNKGKIKFDVCKSELVKIIKGVDKKVFFNIFFLETTVFSWKKHLAPANNFNKRSAIKYVTNTSSTRAIGSTYKMRGNFYDAIYRALMDPYADTIFLLSDGGPTAGKYAFPERVKEKVAEINKFLNFEIHTILIGASSGKNARFMEEFAKANNGKFYYKGGKYGGKKKRSKKRKK